jgi:protocatechuate 3,4-dioxygenase beta subunit
MFHRGLPLSIVLALVFCGVTAAHAGRGGGSPPSHPRNPKPGFIVGTVLDGATGAPIKGAVVVASSALYQPLASQGASAKASHPIPVEYRAVTNRNGRYSLVVSPGQYFVSVSAEGYQSDFHDAAHVRARKTVRVDFDLTEQGLGTVTGAVFGVGTDNTKKPLACAEVVIYPQDVVIIAGASDTARPLIYPPPFNAKTDENGRFTIENVPTGEAYVNAYRLGYGYASVEIHVIKDQVVEVNVELPLQSATIKGTVTDADTGQALAGALVTVKVLYDNVPTDILLGAAALRQATNDHCPLPEFELVGVTDENGAYEFILPIYDAIPVPLTGYDEIANAVLPRPQHTIVAFKRGYKPGTQTIDTPRIGDTVAVDFQLKKA